MRFCTRKCQTFSVQALILVVLSLATKFLCVLSSYRILPAAYPQFPARPPILPPAYRNFFSLDGDTAGLIRSIAGPGILPKNMLGDEPFRATTQPTWTRATTPKDQLIEFMERTLDNLLTGNYQIRPQSPSFDQNLIEPDSLLYSTDKKIQTYKNSETKLKEVDGSGEPDDEKPNSSVSGIPNVYPNISKVPFNLHTEPSVPIGSKFNSDVETIIPYFEFSRPKVPQGGLGPLLDTRDSNIRRHPGNNKGYSPKTVEQFQYGSKPTYKQGLMSSVFEFLGIHNTPQNDNLPGELDHAITEWLLQHSPTYTTKTQKRAKVESGYNTFQKFIAQSVMPLCTPQPESIENFNVSAFMGQWFQVMHSPLMSSSSCSMMSYKPLSDTPYGVGTIFQTLEYSVPRIDGRSRKGSSVTISSGYAVVNRPGQLIYQKSNNPEDAIVHVIHVSESPTVNGRYEYAVLSINCNYPLYVIARDPAVFQQRYSRTVNAFLQRKGLINQVSRFLNIVKPVDFSQCNMPPTLFAGNQ